MNFSVIALAILLVLCAIEIVIGIVRRSGARVVIGIVLGIILALSLFLLVRYGDALYLTGPSYML